MVPLRISLKHQTSPRAWTPLFSGVSVRKLLLSPRSFFVLNRDMILLTETSPDGILRFTLNDMARRNALSDALMDALSAALTDAANDASVKVVIIAANGPAFSAGHDLKEITAARKADDKGNAYFKALMDKCSGLMQSVVNHPKPIIAEVTGVATAAGCQLVASCDLAYAANSARFATPGVNIGLFCSTPMVALSRNVSNKHAMEMLLTGEMIPASRAAEIGLINRAVPVDDLTATTMLLAETIASKSGKVLKIGKRAFYEQSQMGLSDAYAHTSEVMVENMLARDAVEGIGAFLEKRKPVWEG